VEKYFGKSPWLKKMERGVPVYKGNPGIVEVAAIVAFFPTFIQPLSPNRVKIRLRHRFQPSPFLFPFCIYVHILGPLDLKCSNRGRGP